MHDARQALATLLVIGVAVGSAAVATRQHHRVPTPGPSAPGPAPDEPAAACLLFGRPLDVNSASAEDLAAIPGLGVTRAARVIAERGRRGAYHSVEDLAEVPGIGPVTMERLRRSVAVAPSLARWLLVFKGWAFPLAGRP